MAPMDAPMDYVETNDEPHSDQVNDVDDVFWDALSSTTDDAFPISVPVLVGVAFPMRPTGFRHRLATRGYVLYSVALYWVRVTPGSPNICWLT